MHRRYASFIGWVFGIDFRYAPGADGIGVFSIKKTERSGGLPRGFTKLTTTGGTKMTQVTLRQDGKTLTALLSGEIDHHGAAQLRTAIDERIAAASPAILVLDFSAVTFMDSAGIGLILGRHKLVSALGGVVVVQKAPKDIRRTLSVAGIESKE